VTSARYLTHPVRWGQVLPTFLLFFISFFITFFCLVVFPLLGDSPASEFYAPTFRNTLAVPSSQVTRPRPTKKEQNIPKRRHIKFRRRGITQKKEYNIHNTTGVWSSRSLLSSFIKTFLPLMFFWPCIMNWLYINYQLLCTDYYLFIKYWSPVHVSSLKCSSSGGHSCIQAAYGTITLYESSWCLVGTQLEWELTVGGRLLVGRLKTPYQQPSPYSSGVPRGVWGVQTPPPPKFRRYRWRPRSHKQEEPASRFPFAVHCVLIRLWFIK